MTQNIKELLYLIAVVLFVRICLFGTISVYGSSMEPNFLQGDFLVVSRWETYVKSFSQNDVVICQLENEKVIKRVIGVSGDVIDWEQNEQGTYLCMVNDIPFTEYIVHDIGTLTYPLTVPENSYFLLGDNQNVSIDSRTFGTVTQKQIIGRVCLRLYPKITVYRKE